MAWVNFREIKDRFSHIDAEFVSSIVRFGKGGNEVTVIIRFYPWWEHPLYLAARDAGESWAFEDTHEGAREVTVKAIGPVAVNLAPDPMVIDWVFSSEHPLLWDFSQLSVIYVNGPFDVGDLTDRLVARKMPFVERAHLFPYLDPTWEPVSSRGISLPPQLQGPALEELATMNIPVYVPGPVNQPTELVVFLMNDCQYVVAEDFLVDVPEFSHQARWFRPRPAGSEG